MMLLTNISQKNIQAFAPLLSAGSAGKIAAGTLGAVGAVLDETACGALVYELREMEGLLQIHELTVSTPFRRRGAGTELLQYLKGLALDNELSLLCTFPEDDGALRALFISCGFRITPTEMATYAATMEELRKPSELDKLAGKSRPERISAVGSHIWTRFRRAQAEQGLHYLNQCEERKAAWVDSLCLCALRDREICACVIVERYGEKDAVLSYAYASAGGKTTLALLLAAARQRLLETAPADSRLYVTAVNPSSQHLVEMLLPGADCAEKYSVAAFGGESEIEGKRERK
jgi:GNAT superfamily N-acetyltransferase